MLVIDNNSVSNVISTINLPLGKDKTKQLFPLSM